jgi:hypothetical protein
MKNSIAVAEEKLMQKYVDVENADDKPEVSTRLDTLADEISEDNMVRAKSRDKIIESLLNDMLDRVQGRGGCNLWEMARTLCKYGSDVEELLVSEKGVIGLHYLPPPTVRRVETKKDGLVGFVQSMDGRAFGFPLRQVHEDQMLVQKLGNPKNKHRKTTAFEDWEVVHLRMPGNLYGQSVLKGRRLPKHKIVARAKRELLKSFTKICRVHLAAMNIDPASTSFKVCI